MIGTQKMQDNYDGEFKTQTGTIIGSFAGGVTIAAGDTAHLTTTDIIGKTGVTIAAQDSILDGKQNEPMNDRLMKNPRRGLPLVCAARSSRLWKAHTAPSARPRREIIRHCRP
jgi:filamentous hemagglutinin